MAISKLDPFGIQFGTDNNDKTKTDLDTYFNIVTDKLEEMKVLLENLPRRRIVPKLTQKNCFIKMGSNGKAQLVSQLSAQLSGKLDSNKIADGAITADKFSSTFRIQTNHLSNDFALENRHFYKGKNRQFAIALVTKNTFTDKLPMSKFNKGCFTERNLKNIRLTSSKIDKSSIYPRHFANSFTLGEKEAVQHALYSCFAVADLSKSKANYKVVVPDVLSAHNYINLRLVLDYKLVILEHAKCEDSILHSGLFYNLFADDFCCITVHNISTDEQYFLKDAVGYFVELIDIQTQEIKGGVLEENEDDTEHYEITLPVHAEFIIPVEVKEDTSVEFSIAECSPLNINSYAFTNISADVCMKCTLTKNMSKDFEIMGSDSRSRDTDERMLFAESRPTKKYDVTERLKKSKPDANTYKIEAEYKKVLNNSYKTEDMSIPKEYGNTVMTLVKKPEDNKTILTSEIQLYKEADTEQITKTKNVEITVNQGEGQIITNGNSTIEERINNGLNEELIQTDEQKEEKKEENNVITTSVKTITQTNRDLINDNETVHFQLQISANSIKDNNVMLENKEVIGNIAGSTVRQDIETTYEYNEDNKITNIEQNITGEITTNDNENISINIQKSLINNANEDSYEYHQKKEIQYSDGQKIIINQDEQQHQNQTISGFASNLEIIKETEITYHVLDKDGDKVSGGKQFVVETRSSITMEGTAPSNNIIQKAESMLLNTNDEKNTRRNKSLEINNIEQDVILAKGKEFNLNNITRQSNINELQYIAESLQSKVSKYAIEADNNVEITSENPTEVLQDMEVSLDIYRDTTSVLVGNTNGDEDNYEQYRICRDVFESSDEIIDYRFKYTPEELEALGEGAKNKVIPVFTPVLTGINYKEVALEADLKRVERENLQLIEEVENERDNIEALTDQVTKLEATKKQYETCLRVKQNNINDLTTQIKNLNEDQKEEKEELTKQLQQLRTEYNMVREKNTITIFRLQLEQSDLRAVNKRQKDIIESLQQRIARVKYELNNCKVTIEQRTNDNKSLAENNRNYEEKIKELKVVISQEQKKYSELEKKNFETVEQKKLELAQQEQAIINLESANILLQKEKADNEQQIAKNNQEIENFSQEIKDLNGQIRNLKGQLETETELKDMYLKQRDDSAKLLDESKNRYLRLEYDYREKRRTIDSLRDLSNRRLDLINNAEKKINELETELAITNKDNRDKIEKLTNEISNYKAIKESDEKEKEKINNMLTENQKQLSSIQDDLALLENKVTLKEEQIDKQNTQIKSLQTNLDKKNQENIKLNKLTKEQQDEINLYKVYKSKYTLSDKERMLLIKQVDKLKNEIEDIKEEHVKTNLLLNTVYTDGMEQYNKLLQQYKTGKVKQREFNAQKNKILNMLESSTDNVLTGRFLEGMPNHDYINRLTTFSREEAIRKIKGLKDTIQVGITLPSIEKVIESQIQENKDGETLNKNKLIKDNDNMAEIRVLWHTIVPNIAGVFNRLYRYINVTCTFNKSDIFVESFDVTNYDLYSNGGWWYPSRGDRRVLGVTEEGEFLVLEHNYHHHYPLSFIFSLLTMRRFSEIDKKIDRHLNVQGYDYILKLSQATAYPGRHMCLTPRRMMVIGMCPLIPIHTHN